MLSAYDETGIARSSRRSRSSPPRIVSAPQTIGSSAATRLRNTHSVRRKSSGNAMRSANARSSCIWLFTWVVASAAPPIATPSIAPRRSSTRCAASRQTRCDTSALAYAERSAAEPSRERSDAATTGKAGSDLIAAATAASRSSVGRRTSTSTCGTAESPDAASTARSARMLSLPPATKSLEPRPSSPGAWSPIAAATIANTTAPASTRRGARIARPPRNWSIDVWVTGFS